MSNQIFAAPLRNRAAGRAAATRPGGTPVGNCSASRLAVSNRSRNARRATGDGFHPRADFPRGFGRGEVVALHGVHLTGGV